MKDTWTRCYNLSETVAAQIYQDACGGFLVTLIDKGMRRIGKVELSSKEYANLVECVNEVRVAE